MDHSRAGRSAEGRLPHSGHEVVVVMLLDATGLASQRRYTCATTA